MNSNKLAAQTLVATTLFSGVVITVASLTSQIAFAVENAKIGGNGYQCLANETNRWKTESDPSALLPNGYTISKVVVKAGQNCVEVYPTNTANTCYSVNINGNSVTVTKIGSGNDCKNISHLEGVYVVSTVTATPTPTCTDTPTPTPTSGGVTPTITDTPTPTPTTGITVTDTPTPTPTTGVTDTPTPTPTTGASSNQNNSSGSSIVQAATGSDNSPSSAPTTTMAPTGVFGSLMSNASMIIGLAITSLGLTGYAKNKKKK